MEENQSNFAFSPSPSCEGNAQTTQLKPNYVQHAIETNPDHFLHFISFISFIFFIFFNNN